jgi:hypothetical protein
MNHIKLFEEWNPFKKINPTCKMVEDYLKSKNITVNSCEIADYKDGNISLNIDIPGRRYNINCIGGLDAPEYCITQYLSNHSDRSGPKTKTINIERALSYIEKCEEGREIERKKREEDIISNRRNFDQTYESKAEIGEKMLGMINIVMKKLGIDVSPDGIVNATNKFARMICNMAVSDNIFEKSEDGTYKIKNKK